MKICWTTMGLGAALLSADITPRRWATSIDQFFLHLEAQPNLGGWLPGCRRRNLGVRVRV